MMNKKGWLRIMEALRNPGSLKLNLLSDKKGWLRIMEAFTGVLIIAAVLFFQLKNIAPSSQQEILLTEGTLLREIAENTSMRMFVLSSAFGESTGGNILENYIRERIPSGYDVKIKICTLEDPCLVSRKNVFAQDTIITSSSDVYTPRKVKIFMWEK